jgi:hypothetical protein
VSAGKLGELDKPEEPIMADHPSNEESRKHGKYRKITSQRE